METQTFINYYEILELKPSASAAAIDRAYRGLARRYHPDNHATGHRARFDAIVEAHDILKDPLKRAEYHEEYMHYLPPYVPSATEEDGPVEMNRRSTDKDGEQFFEDIGIDRDVSIQNNLLILLYFRRRKNTREAGIGDLELERLSGCPPEHLEFHIWYLKQKGWIATGEDGLLSITIDGVDRASHIYRESANKLITAQG